MQPCKGHGDLSDHIHSMLSQHTPQQQGCQQRPFTEHAHALILFGRELGMICSMPSVSTNSRNMEFWQKSALVGGAGGHILQEGAGLLGQRHRDLDGRVARLLQQRQQQLQHQQLVHHLRRRAIPASAWTAGERLVKSMWLIQQHQLHHQQLVHQLGIRECCAQGAGITAHQDELVKTLSPTFCWRLAAICKH